MVVIILFVIAVAIVTLFSVQNAMPVAVSFLAWRLEVSLAFLAMTFFLAGMVIGMGLLSWNRMRRAARKKSEPGEARSGSETPTAFH